MTEHRAPIGLRTLHASWAAHTGDTHPGRPGHRCTVCANYAEAVRHALATGHDPR
jgi:hypothetical protein